MACLSNWIQISQDNLQDLSTFIRISVLGLMHMGFQNNEVNLLPPVNEVWGKVMFLQVSVILLTGWVGVCLSACWDTTPQEAHPPFFLNFFSIIFQNYFSIFDQLFYHLFHTTIIQPPPTTPPPTTPPVPMVNERAVRILLECMFATFEISWNLA